LLDLHIHILPGFDDGARTMEDSLEMARVAADDGVSTIAATPHVMTGVYDTAKNDIVNAVKELNALLTEKQMPLSILPGAEYYLEPELSRYLAQGNLLTINNTGVYLLVELPSAFIPQYTADLLYELQLQGVTPIVAHPERNAGIISKPGLLYDLVERGILTQITSASITGMFGSTVRKTALRFVKDGIAHIIASDAHSPHGRSPVLSKAWTQIENHYGQQLANLLFIENPRQIIAGQPVETDLKPKTYSHRQSFFKKLLGR
jgi:protein-tyrosine phosphatase